MVAHPKPRTHEEYFACLPEEVAGVLRRIQQDVQTALPAAEPCISYGMPAFRLGKVFFYFAAFKKHVGIYPPVPNGSPLDEKLAPYRGPKGNLSFPLSERMPYALIKQVARSLAAEYATTTGKPRTRSAA